MENQNPLQTKNQINTPPVNKGSISKKLLAITFVISILLGASIAGSVFLWRQNQQLKSEVDSQDARIRNLSDDIKAIKLAQEEKDKETDKTKEPETKKLFDNIKVGQAVDTKSGRLVVNSHQKTSRHGVHPGNLSHDPILRVNFTITNTTETAQTYTASMFNFVTSSKIVNSNIEELEGDSFSSVTLEPSGSITSRIFFDNYDSKPGIFIWKNSAVQEARITLP